MSLFGEAFLVRDSNSVGLWTEKRRGGRPDVGVLFNCHDTDRAAGDERDDSQRKYASRPGGSDSHLGRPLPRLMGRECVRRVQSNRSNQTRV